ncbi:MAG: PDDEXK nuclease domain-containing protein [Chthoniobacter sp.]
MSGIARVVDAGRRQAAWSLNAIISAVYWDIGRQIVVFEQGGKARAGHNERVIKLLAKDLTARFGRGFRRSNLYHIRAFYLAYREKVQTVSGLLAMPDQPSEEVQTASGLLTPRGADAKKTISPQTDRARLTAVAQAFALPWSHYSRLLTVENAHARSFYETEAMRGGWSWRQLDRQIASQLYERTALSRNKAAMLRKGARPVADDETSPEAELKDPYILEFLRLKDEYSETDLEEALTVHLEQFLRELGNDFAFVGRQRRLRIGHEWYPRRSAFLSPEAPSSGGDRPQGRQVHSRRRWPNAHVSELRARALD